MGQKTPTKKQREIMREHLANPFLTSQTDVMRRLRIKDRHTFYRLFTRCMIADRIEEIDAQE